MFQSLAKNLNNYPELKAAIRSILMEGTKLKRNPDQRDIVSMQMYGLIRNDCNTVRVDNRIFETRLYNLFLSDEEMKGNVFAREGELAKNRFVTDGKLDMLLVMEGFITTYTEVFGPLRERFKEKDGRELFLLYLRPIINGSGYYCIEAQTHDQTRTDVIVDYLGRQYVIELKIWRGPRHNADGERQLSQYLDYWNLSIGYMMSFDFNKNKVQGVHQVHVGDKLLYEGDALGLFWVVRCLSTRPIAAIVNMAATHITGVLRLSTWAARYSYPHRPRPQACPHCPLVTLNVPFLRERDFVVGRVRLK